MTKRCRVLSGQVMVLVLFGLPVAPVLCDLACPQASAAVAVGRQSAPRIAAAHASPPCHDSAAGDAAAVRVASVAPADTAGLDASPGHRCEHPRMMAPRGSRGLRVPEPIVVAWAPARHVSPFLAPHTLVSRFASTGAPSPPAGAAFSPVLRI